MAQTMRPDQQAQVIEALIAELEQLPLRVKRDRDLLEKEAHPALTAILTRLGYVAQPTMQAALRRQVVAQVGGLGFIHDLLPPERTDLSEIALNPDGRVWLLRKGAQEFEAHPYRPSLEETWRGVEALLAPLGRSLTEAAPSVDAKLPRAEGMGGARIKVIHPVIATGEGYPALNIRLFEPQPVAPAQILTWQMAPAFLMDELLCAVAEGKRLLVIGGTATGKTTLLAALGHGIPETARIVKIEDPEEIWLPHANVVTLEPRAAQPGASIASYTTREGTDDALRMAPSWLIVGEVRTGTAALHLFRAQMSDHPGLSTFHAESPEHAVFRMGVIMFADAQVRMDAAKAIFAQAVDVVVQVGWQDERRQILGVWEVAGMGNGQVSFRELYESGETQVKPFQRKRGGA
jgi:pilus assembly protein CpaF